MQQVKRRRAVKGDSYYGKAAANYEARRIKQAWWHEEHKQLEKCLEELPSEQDVLDVPFGTGRFLPLYSHRKHRVTGLDSSSDMIGEARKLRGTEISNCDMRVGSAMQLPFGDSRFDILISVRFLSEIVTFADAKKALKEFSRVSRSWAILQLSETSEGNGRLPDEEAAMRDLMQPSQVDTLLTNHGFRPLKRFLVREDGDGISRINHILCEVL